MKPNTKVFAFFNGSDVTNFCAEESFQQWSDTSSVVGYSGSTVHPSNTDLITDATGRIEGSFIIPSTAALKFKTGTREFRLTDTSANNKTLEKTVGSWKVKLPGGKQKSLNGEEIAKKEKEIKKKPRKMADAYGDDYVEDEEFAEEYDEEGDYEGFLASHLVDPTSTFDGFDHPKAYEALAVHARRRGDGLRRLGMPSARRRLRARQLSECRRCTVDGLRARSEGHRRAR